jgi:hypothetical protein
MQRNPNIGWVAAQRFTEKSRGSDTDYSEWVAFDDEA